MSSQSSAAKGESPSQSSRLAVLPQREALGAARGDPFGAQQAPHPAHRPAAAKHEPPPEPAAPPNPYKVAGTVIQGGAKRVYLMNGDRVYEAKQGDELEGGYKVEIIGGDHVILVYTPLGTREELPIATTLGVDLPAVPTRSVSQVEANKPAQLRWDGPQTVQTGAAFTVALRITS